MKLTRSAVLSARALLAQRLRTTLALGSGSIRVAAVTLTAAPPGNTGWIVPVEPLLNVAAAPDVWTPVLARLRTRAA